MDISSTVYTPSSHATSERVELATEQQDKAQNGPARFGTRSVSSPGFLNVTPLAWKVATESPAEVAQPGRIELNYVSLVMSGHLMDTMHAFQQIPRARWAEALLKLLNRKRKPKANKPSQSSLAATIPL